MEGKPAFFLTTAISQVDKNKLKSHSFSTPLYNITNQRVIAQEPSLCLQSPQGQDLSSLLDLATPAASCSSSRYPAATAYPMILWSKSTILTVHQQ